MRYISSAFEKRYDELVAEGDGFEDDPDAYEEENIFFVPENARWRKIASAAHTPEIGAVIDGKMAKMNMAIRGIDADFGPYQADTFFSDLHSTLKADFIMANPPFNLSNWGQEKLKEDKRWKYGVPPAGNANYAWIQHMIHHLAPNGKIGLAIKI